MKQNHPIHKKHKSVTGFKMVNGQQRFFAYVEQEDVKPVVQTLIEEDKKEEVKKENEGCGCF